MGVDGEISVLVFWLSIVPKKLDVFQTSVWDIRHPTDIPTGKNYSMKFIVAETREGNWFFPIYSHTKSISMTS